MTALYMLASEYLRVAEQLANLDLPPEVVRDTLEGMSGDLEHKSQSIAMMVRSMEADAAAIKQWAKDANERAKAIEARAESMRDYLAQNMTACGIEKIEGPGVKISFRKSSAVMIDEPGLIPAEFMKTPEPPPPAPDKTAISKAIKEGREVAGAHIEQRRNLQIS